ncbi:peptidoglycan-binding protein [Streptomyces sp. NBC_01508]|uniref:peptidoglycan-binding domain-containing protein n=1 Tax=Streptomyces sp. NBC_01508 TaxID=2903888 RepID=UPI00386F0C64
MLTKALVGTLAAATLGIGTLAGTTTATAAPAEQVPTRTVTILAGNNPGPNTIRALQRFLVDWGYSTGGIDGIAGDRTKAAWKAFSRRGGGWC